MKTTPPGAEPAYIAAPPQTQKTYFEERLEALGITPEEITFPATDEEGKKQKAELFYQDREGNICIPYLTLDGSFKTYQSGKKEVRYIVKRKHPSRVLNGYKYDNPHGAGTELYIPPRIIEAYQTKRQIKALFVVEGQFKAFAGAKHGVDIVAISGIHNYKASGRLYDDLKNIITTCKVRDVILLHDADALDLGDFSPDKVAPYRPNSFYSSVRNFREALKGEEVEVYYSRLRPEFKEKAKGLDDLFCLYPGDEAQVQTDLCRYYEAQDFFETKNISDWKPAKLKALFNLQSPEAFYEAHREQLGDQVYLWWREKAYQNGQPTHQYRAGLSREEVLRRYPFLAPTPEDDPKYNQQREFRKNVVIPLVSKFEWLVPSPKLDLRAEPLPLVKWLAATFNFGLIEEDRQYFFVRIEGKIVSRIERFQMKATAVNALEDFPEVQNLVARNTKLLGPELLEYLPILTDQVKPARDPQDKCFLYFRNCFVEITADQEGKPINEAYQLRPYEDLNWFIWKADIIDKDFAFAEYDQAAIYQFLALVSADRKGSTWDDEPQINTQRLLSFISALGYMVHTFKDATRAKYILCIDEHSRPGEARGRTGKGIFGKMIEHTRPTCLVPGKQFNFENNRFVFQRVEKHHKVIALQDIIPSFDEGVLFNAVTEGIDRERKNEQSLFIPFEECPKIIVSTNHYNFRDEPSYNARRFILAFSDYFSDERKPADVLGETFFYTWTPEQWNQFFSLVIHAVSIYLGNGLIESQPAGLPETRFINATCQEFSDWSECLKAIEYESLNEMFKSFQDYSGLDRLTKRSFIKYLKSFAEFKGFKYDEQRTQNGNDKRFWLRE